MDIHVFISTFIKKEFKRKVLSFLRIQILFVIIFFVLFFMSQGSIPSRFLVAIVAVGGEIWLIVGSLWEYSQMKRMVLKIPDRPYLLLATNMARPVVDVTEAGTLWHKLKRWASFDRSYHYVSDPIGQTLCLLSKTGLICEKQWLFFPFCDLFHLERKTNNGQFEIEFETKSNIFSVGFDSSENLEAVVAFLQPFFKVKGSDINAIPSAVQEEEKQTARI